MKILKILTLTALGFFASNVVAETITMTCNGDLYKYSKAFLRTAKIEFRKNAEWKPWCEHELTVLDKGARCIHQTTHQITERVQKEVDGAYQFQKRFDLKNTYKSCKKMHSNLQKDKEINSERGWAKRLDFIMSCGGEITNMSAQKTFIENWSMTLDEFIAAFTPSIGAKYFETEKREIPIEITETLDFLISEYSVSDREQLRQPSFYKCIKN